MDWTTVCARFMLYRGKKWLWKADRSERDIRFNLHGRTFEREVWSSGKLISLGMFQYDSNGN